MPAPAALLRHAYRVGPLVEKYLGPIVIHPFAACRAPDGDKQKEETQDQQSQHRKGHFIDGHKQGQEER